MRVKKSEPCYRGSDFLWSSKRGTQIVGGARPSSVPMASILMRLRRMGREGVSPALRAMASDFSLRGQRKVTNRAANPADSLSCVESPRHRHDADGTRRRAFGLRHPWLRPKPASNFLVLAPNRGRAMLALTRFSPWPAAARSTSLSRGLAACLRLGESEGEPIPCPPVTGLAGCWSVGRYATLRMVGVPISPQFHPYRGSQYHARL